MYSLFWINLVRFNRNNSVIVHDSKFHQSRIGKTYVTLLLLFMRAQ